MAVGLAGLLGCTEVDVPKAKDGTGRMPMVAEIPDTDETVRGTEDPPIVTLELGSRLKDRRLTRTEELPGSIIVPNTNLNAVPVTAALQAVLAGSDVSLSWEAGTFETRLVTVTNLSGSLPKVVEKICASARVFCSYRSGLLELKEKETFIIELPSVPTKNSATGAATNTMADTISDLAGDKVKIDQQGGNLLYTTDVEGYEHVREYLNQLRHGRPLIVMQMYIWEVALSKDKATGINWKSFSIGKIGSNVENVALSGATAFSSVASPGVSLGAKLTGKLTADTVLQFLATQGQVQTVSSPQLTFVSGSNAEFRVGGKQRYISQVGTLSSVSGSTSGSSSSNTVSTDSIDTGLKVTVGGALDSGVISAVLDLEIQDVVSLNPTVMTNGTTVDLPETAERKVTTSLRVRPGDNLVLAGLVSSRDTNDRDAIPLPFGVRLTTFGHDQVKNTELVILVKPSVVMFASAADEDKASLKKTMRADEGRGPAQQAVMIDKDGSQPINLPPVTAQPVALQPASSRPELMVPSQPALALPELPATPEQEGSPVDKRMLQRGFSHAFDELQSPSPVYGAASGGVP